MALEPIVPVPDSPAELSPAAEARATDPLSAVREAIIRLRTAQDGVDPRDTGTADTLSLLGDELTLLEEEISTQMAEITAALQARQEERALLHQLVSALPVAMLTTDSRGAVLQANAAAAQLLGVPPATLHRKPIFSYVAGECRRSARDLLATALRAEAGVDGIAVLAPRSGPELSCRSSLSRLPAGRPGDAEVTWVLQPLADTRAPAPDANQTQYYTRYQATHVELSRMAAGEGDLQALLRRVCELAAEGLPGVEAVSIMLGEPGRPHLLAASSALAQAGDGLQHLADTGPVFDAFRRAEPVLTQDAFADPRWPDLNRPGGRARPDRPQPWVALPVLLEEAAAGVVMLYGNDRATLGADVVDQAKPYVAAAQALVRDRRALEELVRVRDQLQEALASRAVIDQAKGMIMFTRGCTADEAFALLVRMSSVSNRKIRDLASEFVTDATTRRRQTGSS